MQMLVELMATCMFLRQESVFFQGLGLPEFKNSAKYFKYVLISNMLNSYKFPAF